MSNVLKKSDHSFAWFNATQFLGALNDNIFKLLVVYFLIGDGGANEASRAQPIAQILTVLPFLLFLAYAGRLADKHSKRNLIIWCKAAELVVMLLAVLAFWLGIPVVLGAVLLLMYTQSAFFSPNKYGIICELVNPEEVRHANGRVQAATYIAILLGIITAPKVSSIVDGHYVLAALVCVLVALVGLVTGILVQTTRPAGGRAKASVIFLRDIIRTIWSIHRKRSLIWSIIGSAYFTFVGVSMYFCVIPHGMSRFGLTKENSTYLFVFALIGIALGSLFSGRCRRYGANKMILLGTWMLGFGALLLGIYQPGYYITGGLLFFMGAGAGIFVVPINAYIQIKSPAHRRGEIVAASEFLSWISNLVAIAIFLFLTQTVGLTSGHLFIGSGLVALILGTVICLCLSSSQ